MSFIIAHVDLPPDAPLLEERDVLARSGLEAEIISKFCRTEDEVIAFARDADAILDVRAPITRRVMENLTRCKVAVRYGVGVDSFDVPAATDHGIVLANAPDFCIEEVSNHALLLILASAKKLTRLDSAVKAGRWGKHQEVLSPMGAIHGQTLGLVAFGKIPRALAPKARALGLFCLAYDPYLSDEAIRQGGAEPARLEDVLMQSDYVSVHAPLTEGTRHMFGEREFRMMKPTAFFINTSRGRVVDEAALVKALKEGWIAGAALDVLEEEPPRPDNALLSMDTVILTPHSASYSDAAFASLRRRVIQEAVRVLKGHWPTCLVNPAVREKVRLLP